MTRRAAASVALSAAGLALACVAGALPASSADGGAVREVAMPGKLYAPQELDVLVGDTVLWRNQDGASHTVTAGDDAFDSGLIAPGGTYTRTFTRPAAIPYACTIHKFMRGVLRVVPVALTGPADPVRAGAVVTLTGLAPDGTGAIRIQRLRGRAWEPVREVGPGAGGTFSVRLGVDAPSRIRAVVGRATSRVVRVATAPVVTARLAGGAVSARVRPARPGARVALQVYDRERFDWRTRAKGRVAPSGTRVDVSLPAGTTGHVRLVVRGGDGWADGASAAIVVR
jgi:plastocyanin